MKNGFHFIPGCKPGTDQVVCYVNGNPKGYELMKKGDYAFFKAPKAHFDEIKECELSTRIAGLPFDNPVPYHPRALETIRFRSEQGFSTFHGYHSREVNVQIIQGQVFNEIYDAPEFENLRFDVVRAFPDKVSSIVGI